MATRAGCECISHVLQGLTELNPNNTILSVDGMSAFNTISRRATLQGLSNVEGGQSALSFASIYGSPSQYLWEDERGVTATIGRKVTPWCLCSSPLASTEPDSGARRTSRRTRLYSFWTTRILSRLTREPRQCSPHCKVLHLNPGKTNLEFSRHETFRVQCFADGCWNI